MELKPIAQDTFDNEIREEAVSHLDHYPSPDGKYTLRLIYAGSYLRGDSWHYAEIIERASGQVIWEYSKGDPIIQLTYYPWAADSLSCYFTLINHSGRIVQYDLKANKLKTIFGSKVQNHIKGIGFVPQNFNGVIFYYTTYDTINKLEHHDVYGYLSDTGKQVNITESMGEGLFVISECGVPGSVLLIYRDSLKVYNLAEEKVVHESPILNKDLQIGRRGYAKYSHQRDVVYLMLLADDDWRYYKLDYRQ